MQDVITIDACVCVCVCVYVCVCVGEGAIVRDSLNFVKLRSRCIPGT